MLRSALFIAAALAAGCQRTPPDLDLEIVGLAKGTEQEPTAEVAPVQVAQRDISPLEVTSSVRLSPDGAGSRDEVDSVTIVVDLAHAQGGELAVEFVAPDGTLYQRSVREVATELDAEQHFEFVLPVSGTWISTYALDGQWGAHVYLRDAELLHQRFELTP